LISKQHSSMFKTTISLYTANKGAGTKKYHHK